ncbi:hypothetical protein PVAG01_10754 [Phlyctema vagabunda]|uniref:Uncharacterized protein n=1 Tax=Phlyctema vagabunda TaxID=108571 RepID=A0ABR4P360_9HELO
MPMPHANLREVPDGLLKACREVRLVKEVIRGVKAKLRDDIRSQRTKSIREVDRRSRRFKVSQSRAQFQHDAAQLVFGSNDGVGREVRLLGLPPHSV